MELKFRKAIPADARFVAESVISAMRVDNPSAELLTMAENLCKRDDVLYSWNNTLIAEADGVPAGSITAYNGDRYVDLKTTTFNLVKQWGGEDFTNMELEAYPGEYYLDSLSVRKKFRQHGIGTALIDAAIDEAQHTDAKVVTLACDPVNLTAKQLYESLGFHYVSDISIFGGTYLKMERPVHTEIKCAGDSQQKQ